MLSLTACLKEYENLYLFLFSTFCFVICNLLHVVSPEQLTTVQISLRILQTLISIGYFSCIKPDPGKQCSEYKMRQSLDVCIYIISDVSVE